MAPNLIIQLVLRTAPLMQEMVPFQLHPSQRHRRESRRQQSRPYGLHDPRKRVCGSYAMLGSYSYMVHGLNIIVDVVLADYGAKYNTHTCIPALQTSIK